MSDRSRSQKCRLVNPASEGADIQADGAGAEGAKGGEQSRPTKPPPPAKSTGGATRASANGLIVTPLTNGAGNAGAAVHAIATATTGPGQQREPAGASREETGAKRPSVPGTDAGSAPSQAQDDGGSAPSQPRHDDLDVASWLAFLETLLDRPEFKNEPTLIAGAPMTETQMRAINRWRHGARPSLWSGDRFLTRLRNPRHIDEYFQFCERGGLSAWARGFPPAWMNKEAPVLASWTDEVEAYDPIWRARSDTRRRDLVGKRQRQLARLEMEGGADWWRGAPRRYRGERR